MFRNNGARGEKQSSGLFSKNAVGRQSKRRKRSRGSTLAVFLIVPLLAFGLVLAVRAAAPSGGTIGPAGPTLNWSGTAVGGASAGEASCVEGVNCDTFTLTVSGTPADYANKLIRIGIQWTIPANDYDLYVHKDSNAGLVVAQGENGGAPATSDATTIDPAATGTGVYTVHVVYFSVTPLVDEYQGTAQVQNKPQGRNASYLKTGISFSPNVMVRAPVASRDGEPSSRTDKNGNHYVAGIRGVPAGVDLWYFDLNPLSSTYDPYMRHPIYRGQPDSFTGMEQTSVGADGGGDVDLAVGFNNPTDPATLAFSSLVAANISTGNSVDRGQTFMLNPLGNVTGGAPADDRQWLEFLGPNSVYLFYRTLAPAVSQIQRSDDGGFTYGPAVTAGTIGQAGYIDVHQPTGTVYVSGSSGQVCVGTPPLVPPNSPPLSYDCHQAATESNIANIFFVVKVADDGTANGTAYVVYSDGKDIFLRHSTDKGVTWSQRVRVSDGSETKSSFFPWMETGPTPGSVGIAWYGSSSAVNNDAADWKVFRPELRRHGRPADLPSGPRERPRHPWQQHLDRGDSRNGEPEPARLLPDLVRSDGHRRPRLHRRPQRLRRPHLRDAPDHGAQHQGRNGSGAGGRSRTVLAAPARRLPDPTASRSWTSSMTWWMGFSS